MPEYASYAAQLQAEHRARRRKFFPPVLEAPEPQPDPREVERRRHRELALSPSTLFPGHPKSVVSTGSRVSVADIQRVVAKRYNLSHNDLLSRRRSVHLILPRHVAMYVAKVLTLQSFVEIGQRFGRRDHTTIIHAFNKIEKLLEGDPALAGEVRQIQDQLVEP